MYRRLILLYTLHIIAFCEELDCDDEGVIGKCRNILQCPSAIKDLKLRVKPKICGFNATSKVPNVCCRNAITLDTDPLLNRFEPEKCPELSDVYAPKPRATPGPGAKAWMKCIEYQDTVIFPCIGTSRTDHCFQHISLIPNGPPRQEYFIGGGIDVDVKEFPHMVLLGYGGDVVSAQWLCGGSLISENFILTAAHCISSEKHGPVTYAALGVLKRSEVLSSPDIYKIKTIVTHPEYESPSKYNDIALLETESRVQFNARIIPACLHVGDDIPDTRVTATGWGALGHRQDLADTMQNVPLWKVPNANCSWYYPIHRHLKQGLDASTQMCYGDDGQIRDTCMGDSGGPLQIVSEVIYCMYLIIGVTSFGQPNCAQLGTPGIYTRVAPYVPWIEAVVWP